MTSSFYVRFRGENGLQLRYGLAKYRGKYLTKILLAGFEAYGHTPHNPAELVARKLDGKLIRGSEIIARIVPKNFFECIDLIWALISETEPEIVVMMGEYGGRATITVERIAQNLNDSARYGLADYKGCSLQGQPTVVDGPAAHYTTLPIGDLITRMTHLVWKRSLTVSKIEPKTARTGTTSGIPNNANSVLHSSQPRRIHSDQG